MGTLHYYFSGSTIKPIRPVAGCLQTGYAPDASELDRGLRRRLVLGETEAVSVLVEAVKELSWEKDPLDS